MSNVKTSVARIRYNLEFSGYEAIVFIEQLDRTFSYPSFVAAPLDAEYEFVMEKLVKSALSKHRSSKPGLRSELRQFAETPRATDIPPLAA